MTEKEDPMKVYSLMLGSYQTNCYLAADDDGVCAVIDPGYTPCLLYTSPSPRDS